MATADQAEWATCPARRCRGVQIPTSDKCVAHAEPDERAAWLRVIVTEGLDARGVRLTPELVEEILEAGRPEGGGRAVLRKLDFAGAHFAPDVFFDMVEFEGYTSFLGATFEGRASFEFTQFNGYAHFANATFGGWASFDGATFGSGVFQGSTFEDWASFSGTTFDRALFGDVTFKGIVTFSGTFISKADFGAAVFETARECGPLVSYGQLDFRNARFVENIALSIGAQKARFAGAHFLSGGSVRVEFGDLALDDARFTRPTVITGGRHDAAAEPFDDELAHTDLPADDELDVTDGDEPDEGTTDDPDGFHEGGFEPEGNGEGVEDTEPGDYGAGRAEVLPRLVSLRGTDVENLTIARLDARACRFAGAHNLDRMRIGERVLFAPTPAGRRWTRRQTIAEEHIWRDTAQPGCGWLPPECVAPPWVDVGEPPVPQQIAQLYRALRKGREDSKDEPGAADFYYGEMEMRRHSGQKRRDGLQAVAGANAAERVLIFLYWLVSGYGLRSSRALAALAVTTVIFAALFATWGLSGDPSFGTSVLFALESTTSLLRGPRRALTPAGEALWIVLRVLGALLVALVLLSLRGRVKR